MLRYIFLLLIGCLGILAACGRIDGTASAPTSAPTASPAASIIPTPSIVPTPVPEPGTTSLPTRPSDPQSSASPSLNHPFTMNVGQQVTIGGDLTVTFESITEESRCPRSVMCAWSGAATSAIKVQRPGQEAASLTLSHPELRDAPDRAEYLDLTIQLLDVSPYPETPEKKIPPDAYTITLIIAPSSEQPSP